MRPLLRRRTINDRVVVSPLPIRRPALVAIVVLFVALILYRRSVPAGGDDWQRYHDRVFTVVNIVDGDTLDIGIPDGKFPHTRIRLWGLDTPEVAHSRDGTMHYGVEASEFAKTTLLNKPVRIQLVAHRSRDKYNRLLAYILLPETQEFFNEMLIEGGYAYADWRFDHPYKKQYKQFERRARRRGVGLWAEITPDDMPPWRQRMETELFGDGD